MSAPPLRPAVFLDRDGVLNENRPEHVRSVAELRLLPGVPQAVARLAHSGRLIVIVTNQAIVGRGLAAAETVAAINAHLLLQLQAAGGRVDGLYVCPHRPEDNCACRKPAPGLLLRAAAELGIDLARSVLIGDAPSDVLAARAAGVRPVLVLSGRGSAADLEGLGPVATFADLPAAVEALLAATKTPPD